MIYLVYSPFRTDSGRMKGNLCLVRLLVDCCTTTECRSSCQDRVTVHSEYNVHINLCNAFISELSISGDEKGHERYVQDYGVNSAGPSRRRAIYSCSHASIYVVQHAHNAKADVDNGCYLPFNGRYVHSACVPVPRGTSASSIGLPHATSCTPSDLKLCRLLKIQHSGRQRAQIVTMLLLWCTVY